MEVKVGTAAIITHKNHMLVGKRGSNCALAPGLWSFPGGSLEYAETSIPHQVCREVKEETGLDVVITRPRYQTALFTTNEMLENLHYLTLYVPCELEFGTKINLRKPIPHAEKHIGKGDEWVWMPFMEILETLSDNCDPYLSNLYEGIDETQLQWLPLPIILHYAKELRLDVFSKEAKDIPNY